jgi:aspartyl-tRNA(Asn)/glutamyl-tRNA(Gln) amidotransferase subunit B
VDFETVIGLEVHTQVLTKSKMFCGCSADYASASPNTHVCPVCLGLPGVLPVINSVAIEKTVMTGLALNCSIPEYDKFDRKNYMYPDLMKGYQISQYDLPIASSGYLDLHSGGSTRRIGITRVHLEEDTARLMHRSDDQGEYSLIDINRAGVPLMEIVGEPDLRSPNEARDFLVELRRILRYIGASTANMEEGQFRCDANISQRSIDGTIVGPKVEIKNMNSFRSVERALEFEVQRQRRALTDGEALVQETRGWVEDRGVTISQRSKEFAHDYRYFPEPDLPPVRIESEAIDRIAARMPELPAVKRSRFEQEFGIGSAEAALITDEAPIADYYESAVRAAGGHQRDIANWLVGDVFALARSREGFEYLQITAEQLADIIVMVRSGEITAQSGKEVLAIVEETGQDPRNVVEERGLRQESDTAKVRQAVQETIEANPGAVADLRRGKDAATGFLIGQVMRRMRGTGNPAIVRLIIAEELERGGSE